MFTPLNAHVEIEPIAQESFMETSGHTFEEKGRVLSVGLSVTCVQVGDIAYFDSYLCAKYPDSTGKVRYLVPDGAIRARERSDA